MISFIVLVTIGYLMGSISSAVLVCKMFSLPDPREHGSKNPGATNVLRIAGKQFAVMVMVADILKGTLPVLLGQLVGADSTTLGFIALAAVVGHMYPVFFGFKGGKGVATTIGALLGFQFMVGILVIAVWLIIAKFFRYSSLASIVSITCAPIFSLMIVGQITVFPPLFIITILVLYKHRENITRLIDGVEPTFTLKSNILHDVMVSPPVNPHEMVVKGDKVVPAQEAVKTPAKKAAAKPKAKKASDAEKPAKKKEAAKPKKAKKE